MSVRILKSTYSPKARLVYQAPQELHFNDLGPVELSEAPIPIVYIDEVPMFLLKDLASLWSYPSPQSLIKKLSKGTNTPKAQFLKFSDKLINKQLLAGGVILTKDANFKLSMVNASWIFQYLKEDLDKVMDRDDDEDAFVLHNNTQKRRLGVNDDDYAITIAQAFPQYGFVDSSIEYTHSAFSSLTNVTKYNYYMSLYSLQKYASPTKMSASEMEQYMKENDFADVEVPRENIDAPVGEKGVTRTKRKPINRQKKYNTNIDPNLIDLTHLLIPGQGFIPEFNINHLCKVPNYYVTSSVNLTVTGPSQPLKKVSLSLFGSLAAIQDTPKLSKNVQQLVSSSENGNSSLLQRYYYTMGYRGPGSGNYKDAALINKINKIPISNTKRILSNGAHIDNVRMSRAHRNKKRHLNSVRGFVADGFSKQLVSGTIDKHRTQVEDCENLEMLHNSLQFNVLLNTYREIAGDTWKHYYKFKQIDFEQLGMIQKDKNKEYHDKIAYEEKVRQLKEELHEKQQEELQMATNPQDEIEDERFEKSQRNLQQIQQELDSISPPTKPHRLADRFVIPSQVPEIVRRLPIKLRDDLLTTTSVIPLIKDVSDHITSFPDNVNPQLKTQLEVVRVPNANSLGWDNLKKFKN